MDVPRARYIKPVALIAAGLLGMAASWAAKSEGGVCQARTSLSSVAYVQGPGGVAYQFRLVIDVSADSRHSDVVGHADLTGPAGNYMELYAPGLHAGRNVYVRWIDPKFESSPGKYERLSFRLECDADSSSSTDPLYSKAVAKTMVYGPGEARPLVQPWAIGCPEEVVIDSRGSDGKGNTQGKLSPPGAMFVNELRLQKLLNDPYGNGFVIQSMANPYPANGGLPTLLAAKFHLPLAYHRSVVKGKQWLARELGQIQAKCPATQVLLSGYSQGAQVAGDVYQQLRGAGISGMVLFGDPSFNGADSSDRSNYRPVFNGSLHERRPFNDSRVWSFCHRLDPVCQGLPVYLKKYRFRYHNDYAGHGEPEWAADYFAGR